MRKDRVAMKLCWNATGSHKLPVSVIGTAMHLMCLTGARNTCPLIYFSQSSTWTDSGSLLRWFCKVFVPGVGTRTGHHASLIMDYMGAHAVLSDPHVNVIELLPSTCAV